MSTKLTLTRRLNRRARTRVGLALLAGFVTFLCLPSWLLLITRLLLGWNAGVIAFLGLAYANRTFATGTR